MLLFTDAVTHYIGMPGFWYKFLSSRSDRHSIQMEASWLRFPNFAAPSTGDSKWVKFSFSPLIWFFRFKQASSCDFQVFLVIIANTLEKMWQWHKLLSRSRDFVIFKSCVRIFHSLAWWLSKGLVTVARGVTIYCSLVELVAGFVWRPFSKLTNRPRR